MLHIMQKKMLESNRSDLNEHQTSNVVNLIIIHCTKNQCNGFAKWNLDLYDNYIPSIFRSFFHELTFEMCQFLKSSLYLSLWLFSSKIREMCLDSQISL